VINQGKVLNKTEHMGFHGPATERSPVVCDFEGDQLQT